MPSNPQDRHEEYRNKLLGLGESSLRKNYYPELRKKMRELEESRTRYKAIFNATADALFIHDAKTYKIIDINEQVCQMFGYTTKEILGLNFEELCSGEPPYTPKNALSYIDKAIASGEQNFEWMSKRKDGSLFWCDVILKSATIGGQECVIASVRDISSRKHLEEQLVHSQKMEAMGQLAGGVAHDFNNMLSGIIGSAEIINTISNGNDKVKKLSQVILKAAHTAGNLTRQLLSFSRKGTIKQHTIHIHKAIHNAEEILRRSIASKFDFDVKLNADNDLILGDLSQIENIVINMSLNARDAMPEGGTLTIITDNRSPEGLNIPDTFRVPPDGCICITISDTGFGMEDELRQHIFEPFFTTKEIGKGTGLGLSAVYGAIKRHSGFIDVDSTPGLGTTFSIFLPLTTQDTPLNTSDNESEVQGTGKILLIDDEEVLRYVGKIMLGTLGYEVVTAEDGLRGIEAFIKEAPDVVLLDMVMPNMSSADCFYTLQELNPNIPVIAVSGYSADSTIDELLKHGLAGFLEKPYKAGDLSRKIASVLNAINA